MDGTSVCWRTLECVKELRDYLNWWRQQDPKPLSPAGTGHELPAEQSCTLEALIAWGESSSINTDAVRSFLRHPRDEFADAVLNLLERYLVRKLDLRELEMLRPEFRELAATREPRAEYSQTASEAHEWRLAGSPQGWELFRGLALRGAVALGMSKWKDWLDCLADHHPLEQWITGYCEPGHVPVRSGCLFNVGGLSVLTIDRLLAEGKRDKANESATSTPTPPAAEDVHLPPAVFADGKASLAYAAELAFSGNTTMRSMIVDVASKLQPQTQPTATPIVSYFPDDVAARVLRFLLKKYPVLVKQEDIGVGESLPTIKARLLGFSDHELIHRPQGPKSGCQLTEKGKILAESLPPEK